MDATLAESMANVQEGSTFGSWVVLAAAATVNYERRVLCRCACGSKDTVRVRSLVDGLSTRCRTCSAGKHREARRGRSTKEYAAWRQMIARCTRPRYKAFADYGGRGITVCDRWLHDFPAFLADVGRAPSPSHTLGRIDNDGTYQPGNVRWETRSEQNNNRRVTVRLTVRGVTKPLAVWADETGIARRTLHTRLAREGCHDQILRRPAGRWGTQ
jgi:hypothetical protein